MDSAPAGKERDEKYPGRVWRQSLKSFFTLLLGLFVLCTLTGEVLFDPPQLTLPADSGSEFSSDVRISNLEKEDLVIDFMASSDEWSIVPSTLVLKGGHTGRIRISSKGYHPDEAVVLLMLSDREDVPYLFSINPASNSLTEREVDQETGIIQPFVFFYTPGCEICEEFYDIDLPALEKEIARVVRPEKLNVLEPGNYERLEILLSKQNRSVSDFPILIAGGVVYSGEKEIKNDFTRFMREHPDSSFSEQIVSESVEGSRLPDLGWIAVFLAGLLDGINPCAFTTLIFLISYLRLLGKKGLEILKIGGSFTLAVFVTYFLVGLGAFQFIRMADSFELISRIIKYALGFCLFFLSFLSLLDSWRISQGRASQTILQLSANRKKKIHSVVRTSSRSAFVYFSSFGAGVIISLYELGCTGQIYLPMLVYMVKQEQWSALAPLALYNTAFILPLVLVFALFYKGSDSDRIAEFFQKNMGKIKLATAVLFILMGVFILFF